MMIARFLSLTLVAPLVAPLVAMLGSSLVGGCAAPQGPDVLTIAADDYDAAFEAAMDVARDKGMSASFRNRRSGIIMTEPVHASTILEPWHHHGEGPGQLLENTFANHRRRARFEFTPAGFNPAAADVASPSADLLATGMQPPDLTGVDGDLELRVWVYVERGQYPGTRKSTWSRKKTTRSVSIPAEGDSEIPTGLFWAPVSRDEAFEKRLLGEIRSRLHQNAG